ncbi:MAG: PhzF family phenazine biosynthesis protein [Candidatus Promineifilaceae bacterium]
MNRPYKYYICDVFTDTRFGGNPLAVLPEAAGLSAETMQQIAREFNFSESTFVFPAEQGHTRRVRIFTPTQEVPFAGHPNVGTAFTLATIGEVGTNTSVTFEEDAGLVPITIRAEENRPIWCELFAPQDVWIGRSISAETAAALLSLIPADIVTSNHPPQEASVGLPFLIIELRDKDALQRARINLDQLHALEASGIVPDVHLYTHGSGEFDIHARMYAPLDNVPEDPATGSANCALVGMLTQINPAPDGAFSWRIAQGFEMGRPSILSARTRKTGGTVTGVWIGGSCVMVSEGWIEVG